MLNNISQGFYMYEPKEFKAGLRTDEEICKLIYEDDMP